MSDEQTIYISPLNDWRIISRAKFWGIQGFEVEHLHLSEVFWEGVYDGEHNLFNCFRFLKKAGVISKDEMNFQIKKWKSL